MCYTILKSEVIMKISKNGLIVALISLLILLGSLTVMLVNIFSECKFWTHPVLNFLFCIFAGFGVLSFVLGVIKKSPAHFFLSALLVVPASFYAIIQYLYWWITLVIIVVIIAIFPILSIITCGNKTENIELNKSKDYKNY